MRRHIGWLVGATTSAAILALVIPLCLLVRTIAEDRALASGNQEARNVAILVSSLHGDPELAELVAAVDERGPALTSVLAPGGTVLGTPDPDMADDAEVARAATGQAFTDQDGDGARIFVPVAVGPSQTYVVRTTVADDTMRSGVAEAWLLIVALGLALILAALAVADRLARTVSTPVTDLAEVALRLKDGELDARAVPTGPPETRELAEALNQLADRITELLVAERAQVGDLSHRLRTPVTALRLDAEAVTDEELAGRLQTHIAALQRTIDAIVRDARRPLRHSMRAGCDARAVVRDRVAFWAALAEDQQRRLTVDITERPVHVPVDASDLTDVVDVLVDNVFAHTADDVAFSVSFHERDGHAQLLVVDEGPGIAAGDSATPRPGTSGLGLQIARRTVAGIGGELTVQSVPGRGTAVSVTLPLTPPGQHA
jgi:signal transduction histidine kinase